MFCCSWLLKLRALQQIGNRSRSVSVIWHNAIAMVQGTEGDTGGSIHQNEKGSTHSIPINASQICPDVVIVVYIENEERKKKGAGKEEKKRRKRGEKEEEKRKKKEGRMREQYSSTSHFNVFDWIELVFINTHKCIMDYCYHKSHSTLCCSPLPCT
jgi:hypothetical protein